MEKPYGKCRGPGACTSSHRIHAGQISIKLVRPYVLNGRLSTIKDCHIRGTIYLSERQKGTKEEIHGLTEKYLSSCHIDQHKLLTITANHRAWRYTTHQAVTYLENPCKARFKMNRKRRKNKTTITNQSRLLLVITAVALASNQLAFLVINMHTVNSNDVERPSMFYIC